VCCDAALLDVLEKAEAEGDVSSPAGCLSAPRTVRINPCSWSRGGLPGYSHEMITHKVSQFAETSCGRNKRLRTHRAAVIGYGPLRSRCSGDALEPRGSGRAGFRYDASHFPDVHDRYGSPTAARSPHRLKYGFREESPSLPLSTVTVLGWRIPVAVAGISGCFRTLHANRAIRRINEREDQPAVVYLHPWRWIPANRAFPWDACRPFPAFGDGGATMGRLRAYSCLSVARRLVGVLASSGILVAGGIA